MSFYWFFFLFLMVYVSSVVATGVLRNHLIKNKVIDIPNERSSHTQPTPRGAGVVISISIVLGVVVCGYLGYLQKNTSIVISSAIFLVAIVGWFDDKGDLPFYWRILFYSLAAAGVVIQCGALEKFVLGYTTIPIPAVIGVPLTFLAVVWLTNLYNFMDGADSIAALQAISAGFLGGVLLHMEGEMGLFFLCFMIVSSSLGFLYWNFPPAKIFMGDVGSCVLGFSFATIALLSDLFGAISVTLWCMLLSTFICDATFTFIKRIINGERWYMAHRSHAYQRLVQMGMSHKSLGLAFLMLNIIFIWPAVFAAYLYPGLTLFCAIGVVLLMFIIWLTVQRCYTVEIR